MIPRRNVEFGFEPANVPRDWYGDDPFTTTHLDALSLLFPEGERFFVDSVKQLRHLIEDDDLRQRVAGFIGQEAMHGREHRAFNRMLVEHGYAAAPGVDAWLESFLQLVRRVLPRHSQLAVTCALEHFTAIMAERLLRDERMREPMHPSVRPLWMWHALEESEHKAVAYDVYLAAGGGYVRRVAIMILTTVIFFCVTLAVQARLMRARGVLFRPWRWLGGIQRMWIWPGYFTRMIPAYLDYFRPGFHPDDRDTTALLDAWRDHLFGKGGVLAGKLEEAA
jgi:predicted metal-dependent hydrolase